MCDQVRWTRLGGASCAAVRPALALAVGDRGALPRDLLDAASGAQVVVTAFDDLDAALLARVRPELVLSRAISRGFDALDLAHRLTALRFRGCLVTLAEALPRPEVVRAEIARACPALPLEVIVTGRAASHRQLRAL